MRGWPLRPLIWALRPKSPGEFVRGWWPLRPTMQALRESMALPCSAPRPTFSRRESRQRYARNLLVPGPPAQGGGPPWIPPPSALAVLVAGNKTLKHPRDKAPAAPRIENRECSLDETKGKNKTDLPTNSKWQIGLFLWLKALSRGCGNRRGSEASPSGDSKGRSPWRAFGDFPRDGKVTRGRRGGAPSS